MVKSKIRSVSSMAGPLAFSCSVRQTLTAGCLLGALLMLMAPQAYGASGPRIIFTDVEAGPVTGGPNNLGVPISIFGKGFGSTRGTSSVTIGGVEVASYLVWGSGNSQNSLLDMIVVQPGPGVQGGPIVVTVNGQPSNPDFSFAVNSGSIYYVSPSGSDVNPCSAVAPCATILRVASSVMAPGDTVLVRGGSYAEGQVWIQIGQSGSPGQPKVIKNYPNETPVFNNSNRDIMVDANYITISGLTLQNGKAMNIMGWGAVNEVGNKFVNNTFSGTINYASIETEGSNHLIAGNNCIVAGSTQGTMGHCYYIAQGDNNKILYNVASGQPGYGIHIYEEQRASTDFQRVISNILVEGNVLRGSTARAGLLIAVTPGAYNNYAANITVRNNVMTGNDEMGMITGGTVHDMTISNNTFYENGQVGLYIDGSATVYNITTKNNLIVQTNNGTCRIDCYFATEHLHVTGGGSNIVTDNNSYHPSSPIYGGVAADAHAVTGTVQFANPGGLDFHLLTGSVVIDRGVTLADVPWDSDRVPRPQGNGYDIGAFEFPTGGQIPNVLVSVTPASASIGQGASQQFTASVVGTTNSGVTWSVTPSLGTVSAAGLYTAPASVTFSQPVTITATSVADPTRSASATVTLNPPVTVTVAVAPLSVTLNSGGSQQFSATIGGTTNTGVTWSLSAAVGTITASGLFTAPASIATQQSIQVRAISVADPTRSASATVMLNPPVSVTVAIAPLLVTLNGGGSQQFSATVGGTTNTGVMWSLSAAVGTITASGVYTAPASIATQQSIQVRATSVADPTKSASATVTLNPAAATFNVWWTQINQTQVRVNWTAPAGRPSNDYIALSSYGAQGWWRTWGQYTGGAATGSFVLNLPTDPGVWEFRYMFATDYFIAARSPEMPINVAQFSVSGTPATVARNTALSLSWTAPAGRPAGEFIGLYKIGAPADQPIWYQFTSAGATSGVMRPTNPATAGSYEFRYVLGGKVSVVHVPITVN